MKKKIIAISLMLFVIMLTTGCGGHDMETDPGVLSKEEQVASKKREESLKQEEEFRAQQEKIRKDREWNDQNVVEKVISKGWEMNDKLAEKITGVKGDFFYVDAGDQPDGAVVQVFKIGSDLAVSNEGENPTVTLDKDYYVTELWTYHWNGGSGHSPGAIEMIDSGGKEYGPWLATSDSGVYWVAKPNQILPAGRYIVVDSDPFSWSQNGETKGKGMTWMNGIAVNN